MQSFRFVQAKTHFSSFVSDPIHYHIPSIFCNMSCGPIALPNLKSHIRQFVLITARKTRKTQFNYVLIRAQGTWPAYLAMRWYGIIEFFILSYFIICCCWEPSCSSYQVDLLIDCFDCFVSEKLLTVKSGLLIDLCLFLMEHLWVIASPLTFLLYLKIYFFFERKRLI